jgi:hypothetical protein
MSAAARTDCCRDVALRHCHGTYVVHRLDGECTEDGCTDPVEVHAVVVRCVELTVPCACD